MATIPEFGSAAGPDNTIVGTRRDLVVPADVEREVFAFLFESKRWHEDVEIVHDRVRQWRQRIRAANVAPMVPVEPTGATAVKYPWLGTASDMRSRGHSWRAISRSVGQPESTVRRLVAQASARAAA